MDYVYNKTRIFSYIALILTGILFLWSFYSYVKAFINLFNYDVRIINLIKSLYNISKVIIIYSIIAILNIMIIKKQENKLIMRLLFATSLALIITQTGNKFYTFVANILNPNVWEYELHSLILSQFIQLTILTSLLSICIYQAFIYFKHFDKVIGDN